MYVGPQLAVVEIAEAELPAFVGAVDAVLQPVALLLGGDVQEQLDDRRALVDEHLLELADVGVALAPHRRRRQLLDAHDEHVLVVAAVEHADLALGGRVPVDPPEEVVGRAPPPTARRRTMTRTPAGLSPVNTSRSTPSLPPASIAWSTTRTDRVPSANSIFCSSARRCALDVELGLGRLLVPAERLAGIVIGEIEVVADAYRRLEQLGVSS